MATENLVAYVYNVYVTIDDEQAGLIASFSNTRKANSCANKLTKAFPDNEYFMLKEVMDRDIDDVIEEMRQVSCESSDEEE